MLTKWSIANFKSIDNKVELDLAPLTLLVGPNNSGKSTVIQSILLIAQTFSSHRSESQLLLNGEFVRLGRLDELLHIHQGSKETPFKKKPYLEIGFELQPTENEAILPRMPDYSPTRIKVNIKFENRRVSTADGEERHPTVARLDLDVESTHTEEETTQTLQSQLRVTTRRGTSDIPQILIKQEQARRTELSFRPNMSGEYTGSLGGRRFRRPIRISSGQTQYVGMARRQTAELVPIGTGFNRFLPNRLVVYYNERELKLRSYIDEFMSYIRMPKRERPLSNAATIEFADFINRYFYQSSQLKVSIKEFTNRLNKLNYKDRKEIYYLLGRYRDKWLQARVLKSEPEIKVTTVPLPEPFDTTVNLVSAFFSRNIKYLGPLREEPRLVYALPFSGDPTDVGLKGEYTAAVLNAHRNMEVSYWDPEKEEIIKTPLSQAVNYWSRYLGIANSVEVEEAGKLGHIVAVEEAGVPKYLDLTNVGVGVSQVLPILVSGLLAKEGSLLCYEQPEIHLHPKIQAGIADFFLSLIHCQKRCIVESHSEYLVNRIRRRLAEAQNDGILSKVRLLFSENIDSVSRFREVAINKYGAITDWPQGFFDQAQQEAQILLETSMRKRSKERHERSHS